jgi:hypothetical protein
MGYLCPVASEKSSQRHDILAICAETYRNASGGAVDSYSRSGR